jgi:hypothetical protein
LDAAREAVPLLPPPLQFADKWQLYHHPAHYPQHAYALPVPSLPAATDPADEAAAGGIASAPRERSHGVAVGWPAAMRGAGAGAPIGAAAGAPMDVTRWPPNHIGALGPTHHNTPNAHHGYPAHATHYTHPSTHTIHNMYSHHNTHFTQSSAPNVHPTHPKCHTTHPAHSSPGPGLGAIGAQTRQGPATRWPRSYQCQMV